MSFFGQQNNQQQGTGFGGFGSNNNATSGGKSFSIDIALVKVHQRHQIAVDSRSPLSKGNPLTSPRYPSRIWPAASDKRKRAFRRHDKYKWRRLWGVWFRRYVSGGSILSRSSPLPTSFLSKHWQAWNVTIAHCWRLASASLCRIYPRCHFLRRLSMMA